MTALIIIVKIIITIFLIGALLGALTKFSPSFRNQAMSQVIEYFVGGLGVVLSVWGLFYCWFS